MDIYGIQILYMCASIYEHIQNPTSINVDLRKRTYTKVGFRKCAYR